MPSPRSPAMLISALILAPAVVLAWMGWRSTQQIEGQAVTLARQQASRALADGVAGLPARESLVRAAIQRAAHAVARGLERDLPLRSPGHALAAARAAAGELLGGHVGGGIVVRVLDAEGRVIFPAPAGDAALSALLEWPEFVARRRSFEVAEFAEGDGPRAARLAEALAGDLGSDVLIARGLSHAAGAHERAGNLAAARRCRERVRRLPRSSALSAGPLVVEAQLVDEDGRAWVGCAADEGWLEAVPCSEGDRDRWRRALGRATFDAGAEGAADARRDAHVERVPAAGDTWVELSVPMVAIWPVLLPEPEDASCRVRLLPGDAVIPGADASTPVQVLGRPATLAVAHAALHELTSYSRQRTVLMALAIAALFGIMITGLVVVRRAVARERAARQLRDDFIANVSHDLRTPLTSVRMYAEMLAEPGLDDERRARFAGIVDAEGARLAALVDDLLDFAALAQKRRRLEPEVLDLSAAVHAAAQPWVVLAGREGVALEVATGTPVEAFADTTALLRIVGNLMHNAFKYGRPADRTTPRVVVRALAGPAVEVRDNGPGIPAESSERIFDRFWRGGNGSPREGAPGERDSGEVGRGGGSGIGLALSRELARAMGGELGVRAEAGETVFRLDLPGRPSLGDTAGSDA